MFPGKEEGKVEDRADSLPSDGMPPGGKIDASMGGLQGDSYGITTLTVSTEPQEKLHTAEPTVGSRRYSAQHTLESEYTSHTLHFSGFDVCNTDISVRR